MRSISISSLDSLTALAIQDSIVCSPAWSERLSMLEAGFVVVRFDSVSELVRSSSHFQLSIAIVEKLLFQSAFMSGGNSPRMRRALRPIARIDGNETAQELERLLLLGCHGFVRDHVSGASLRRILRAVTAGEIAANRKLLSGALRRLLTDATAPKLTHRELEVLSLIAQRFSNKHVAERLFISGETLRWHLRNLYSKTELRTRGELLEYARAMSTTHPSQAASDVVPSSGERLKAFAAGAPQG